MVGCNSGGRSVSPQFGVHHLLEGAERSRLRVNVADLRGAGDLPFRVSVGDLLARRDIARADPFPGTRVAVAEGEQFKAWGIGHYYDVVAPGLDRAQSIHIKARERRVAPDGAPHFQGGPMNGLKRTERARAPLTVVVRQSLEKLGGDRRGQYSIRINDQWRLCFRWRPDGPWDVEIADYH